MAMQVIKEGDRRPIKIWTDYVDPGAMEQLRNLAALPFIFKNGPAAMPDVHKGIGSTVGSVIPTEKAIIPAAVGVDIGCGMIALMLSLRQEDLPDSLTQLRHDIERGVPMGAGTKWLDAGHGLNQGLYARLLILQNKHPSLFNQRAITQAVEQAGSLGGGNHFIELCIDQNGNVWIMLHSGSRGIGNKIGRYFIEMAKEEMADLGIIPGSMGQRSYIVRGKGNPDSYNSCSHGAGRLYSRRAAKEHFTVDDLVKATEGVECRKDAGVLDEIPGAYKDLDQVMAHQSDLVEILHTLKAVMCLKGN